MEFISATAESALIAKILSAVAVFCAIVTVAWPYLERDPLEARMREVASERERIRLRERNRLNPTDATMALRPVAGKLFANIVKRLRLGDRVANGGPARSLRMAGYRGNAALVTLLAVRTIAPVVMFAVTLLYVVFVLPLANPLIVKVLIALAAGGLGYYLPGIYVKNRILKRQQSIQRAWPDALDLLLICVESGMSIESAMKKVSEEIGPQSVELADELSLTTAELSFLQDRHQAFENLSERTGLDAVKAVVASLKQAEKHGTSLGRSLRILAQENRDMRLSLAEKKAAALPPKLTVPMILFFLPVLFAVIITPAAIQVMATH